MIPIFNAFDMERTSSSVSKYISDASGEGRFLSNYTKSGCGNIAFSFDGIRFILRFCGSCFGLSVLA
ncbi:hypothetical protein GCM10020370_45640 [Paenibacillus hodogayensis]